jgi:hypothetical protein
MELIAGRAHSGASLALDRTCSILIRVADADFQRAKGFQAVSPITLHKIAHLIIHIGELRKLKNETVLNLESDNRRSH